MSRRRLAYVWLGAVLLLGAPLQAQALRQPRIAERGDSLFDALFQRIKVPGLSAAVGRADGKSTRFQSGFANLESRVRVERNTSFRIGSLSKLFTAAITARLVAQGKLDLDAPINHYLPSLPPAYRLLTARQLAGHLAGVRHYGSGEFLSTAAYPTVSASLGVFLKDTLVAPPGSRYFYSSYGYNLLGAVGEAAAGRSYRELLQTEVIVPLGLGHTQLEPSGTPALDEASPYSAENDGTSRPSPKVDLSDRWPSGGLISTPEDLVKFGLGVFHSGYLPDSMRTLFLTSQETRAGVATNVGLGWRIAQDALGRRYVHHGGSSLGGRGFLLVYPDKGVAVALLTNTEGNLGETDALAFARLVLP